VAKRRRAEVEDEEQGGIMDALMQAALKHGSKQIETRVIAAIGRLNPASIVLEGLVDDVGEDGTLDLRVAVRGRKAFTVTLPYAPEENASEQFHFARQLLGRKARLTLEVEQ
jgi:hypothetical protein